MVTGPDDDGTGGESCRGDSVAVIEFGSSVKPEVGSVSVPVLCDPVPVKPVLEFVAPVSASELKVTKTTKAKILDKVFAFMISLLFSFCCFLVQKFCFFIF